MFWNQVKNMCPEKHRGIGVSPATGSSSRLSTKNPPLELAVFRSSVTVNKSHFSVGAKFKK